MMRPVAGSMPKVTGSSRATPMAAERPGRQPMVMPTMVDASMASRLMGEMACMKPAAMRARVSVMTIPLLEQQAHRQRDLEEKREHRVDERGHDHYRQHDMPARDT